jgi:nicotinate-nucleotide pyrophosphorylase (carboxylating)
MFVARDTMPVGTPMADDLEHLARTALAEDAPSGDITSNTTVPPATRCAAELVVKQEGVLAGVDAASAVFAVAATEDGSDVEIDWKAASGDRVGPGDRAALIRGDARTVLRAERPSLNLLGHLSGIATLTRRFVDAASPAEILCTRKTLPGLRAVERAAVAAGGGTLHRASLSDAILIKDTHVRIAGGVSEAVRRARAAGMPVEVEVETLEQLDEALVEGAERILLDNATPERVREAIARVGDALRLEISGGVSLDNVGAFVEAGARVLSVGRLTHSAPALDLSLEVMDIDG